VGLVLVWLARVGCVGGLAKVVVPLKSPAMMSMSQHQVGTGPKRVVCVPRRAVCVRGSVCVCAGPASSTTRHNSVTT
jgi:hypothetical protein